MAYSYEKCLSVRNNNYICIRGGLLVTHWPELGYLILENVISIYSLVWLNTDTCPPHFSGLIALFFFFFFESNGIVGTISVFGECLYGWPSSAALAVWAVNVLPVVHSLWFPCPLLSLLTCPLWASDRLSCGLFTDDYRPTGSDESLCVCVCVLWMVNRGRQGRGKVSVSKLICAWIQMYRGSRSLARGQHVHYADWAK